MPADPLGVASFGRESEGFSGGRLAKGMKTIHALNELEVDVSFEDHVAFVKVKGDVDWYSAPVLEEAFADLTRAHRSQIVVDLGDVPFIDTKGLNVLARNLQRVRAANGELALRSPNASVSKVLEISGLASVVPID